MTTTDLEALVVRLERAVEAAKGVRVSWPDEDEWLTLDEAEALTKLSQDWLKDHAAELPFMVRVSRKNWRVSKRKLQAWMANRPQI